MESLERELRRGTLELLLLRILADEPTYGYELLSRLGKRSGGRFHIKEGTLYPVLYRMENRGWIKGRWVEKPGERQRCFYKLTAEGRRVLAQKKKNWNEYIAAVNSIVGASNA